jgi:hypothetical protein
MVESLYGQNLMMGGVDGNSDMMLNGLGAKTCWRRFTGIPVGLRARLHAAEAPGGCDVRENTRVVFTTTDLEKPTLIYIPLSPHLLGCAPRAKH